MTKIPAFILAAAVSIVLPDRSRAASTQPHFAPDCAPTAAALLRQSWSAEWITHPTASTTDYGVFLFRKTFTLDAQPKSYIVHVSADNRYRLYVNGQSVCFGPQRSDTLVTRFDSVDIARHLVAGRNVIAAEVVNFGDYRPAAIVSIGTTLIVQGDTPAEKAVDTDSSWRVQRVACYTPVSPTESGVRGFYVAGPGDSIDGRDFPWGWTDAAFDDSGWIASRRLGHGSPYNFGAELQHWLMPRNIPLLPETPTRFKAVRRAIGVSVPEGFVGGTAGVVVPAHSNATVLLDQGVETLAFPILTVSGGKGAHLQLAYAEALVDDQHEKGNRNDIEGRHLEGLADRFIADGGAQRRFEPIDVRCYRYAELSIRTEDQPITIDDLHSLTTGYPFVLNGSFSSDDPSLGKIWEVGWRTARRCAFETYMDCPYYERLQYLGDTRIQALISLYASGDDRLVRNALELADRSRFAEGLTQSRAPSNPPQVINTFSLAWIEMVHDLWMLRDEPDFIRARLDGVEDVLRWFEHRVDPSTGILGPLPYWSFVDWTNEWSWNSHTGRGGEPAGAATGGSSIVTLQFALALDHAAQLFGAFGRDDLAKHYTALASSLRAATLRQCWDEHRGMLADSPEKQEFSQHANALAVLSGAVRGPAARQLIERTLADPSLVTCSLYFRFYLLRAAKEAGLGDDYVGQLGPWKGMLDRGLTTFAETADPTRSDCHAWSASPVYEFLATVCGVEPGSPGFKSVRIEPHPGTLRHVEGTVPHPLGFIRVSLDRQADSGMQAIVELPAGLDGVFVWHGHTWPLHPGAQTIRSP